MRPAWPSPRRARRRRCPPACLPACRHTAAACCSPLLCREELQQPVFMAIDALEFPELHDESIPAMAFIRHLTPLLQAAGVRDFAACALFSLTAFVVTFR